MTKQPQQGDTPRAEAERLIDWSQAAPGANAWSITVGRVRPALSPSTACHWCVASLENGTVKPLSLAQNYGIKLSPPDPDVSAARRLVLPRPAQ